MTKLSFIGDIFPGDEFFTRGFGVKSKTKEENVELWSKSISEVIGKTDYLVGNLESPLIDEQNAKKETFYGLPLFADVLKGCGVNILHVANNHIMEHGTEGFDHTMGLLHEKGMDVIGSMKDGKPEILTIKCEEATICMAGFCDEQVCSIENSGCYASLDEKSTFDTLKRMKAQQPDIIILCFHWGNEYIHIPSLAQRNLAQKLIDHGANLIIGHHPHVIQPYEQYKDGHIIFSLGNFCFDDVQSAHFGKGMMAQITIQDKAISKVSFSGIQIQDMAYEEKLVKPMPTREFERYFSRINNKYYRLQRLSDTEYQKIYGRTLRYERTKERICMRFNIIMKILDMRHKHKALFLHNLKKYIV